MMLAVTGDVPGIVIVAPLIDLRSSLSFRVAVEVVTRFTAVSSLLESEIFPFPMPW